MSRPGLPATLLLLLASQPQLCAQPAPVPVESQQTTLRITVTLVQVDVVVTDAKGNRVTGLAASDFQILQDGQPQAISTFAWNPAPPPSATPPAALSGAPAPITPGQVRRTVALVVDDLSLTFENIVRVRTALRTYIERQMQPGDLVAIVRTGGGVVALEQFTTDRRLLLSAVDLLKWRFSGRCGINPITPIRNSGAEPETQRPQNLDYGCAYSALGTIGSLEQVVRGMQRMPGRKSVVLLSNSLQVTSALHESMDHLTDLANRSAVSIYSIDPEGLKVKGAAPEEGSPELPGAPSGTIFGDILTERAQEAIVMEDGLRYLASRTGGLFYSNNNDIAGCIGQAAADQLGYYLLGYSPSEDTFQPERPGKPKFHKVTVRVLRPGLRVRWKTGFSGVPDELRLSDLDSVKKTREQQLADALSSPFSASGIRVRLTSMFTHLGPAVGPAVRSLLHFDANDLNFTKETDGKWHASVDIVTVAFRGLKQTFIQSERPQQIALPDDLYQKALREGFLFHLGDVAMKEPGPFILRAVVRDRRSERMGSASQFLDVPDTRKGKLALTSINLRLATPGMIRALQHAENTLEDPPADPGEASEVADGSPAVRRYRPGQSLVYGYAVVNPKLKGSAKQPKLSSEVRVYRDGKLIYSGKGTPLAENGKLDEQRYIGGGLLKLGDRMLPGEYLLQIVLTDQNLKRGKGQTAQWIDFEVLPSARVATTSASQR